MDSKMRYSDADELMNQFGSVLPENMTITDVIRRDNNVSIRYAERHERERED